MIFDMTNSVNILLALIFSVCLIYLGVEVKRSVSPAISLAAFIILLIVHAVQFSMYPESSSILLKCISMDFIFIFLNLNFSNDLLHIFQIMRSSNLHLTLNYDIIF